MTRPFLQEAHEQHEMWALLQQGVRATVEKGMCWSVQEPGAYPWCFRREVSEWIKSDGEETLVLEEW